MKYPRKSARAIALSVKPVATGVLVCGLFAASLGIVVLGKGRSTVVEEARSTIAEALSPVVQALASPVNALQGAAGWVHDMGVLHAENERLHVDNTRLLRWQSVATELASENERLKSLLKFAPSLRSTYISARIAVDAGNAYSRSVVIGAGAAQGVVDDSAVVDEAGLVGRVVHVGKKTSRVLLLTDMNSRIPVIAQHAREHAIASGNGGDALTLMYLPENSKIAVGETMVTAGDGNVLPAGLPVGVVTRVENGAVTVKSFADWSRLEYVSVIDPAD